MRVSEIVTPQRRAFVARVGWSLVIATLALLPWEYRLPQLVVGQFTLTTLEAVWLAAIAAWFATLVTARRRPDVPAVVLAGLLALAVLNVASALLADGYNRDALVFVARSAVGWILFVAVADFVSSGQPLRPALRAIVLSASISAGLGILLLAAPGLSDVLGTDRFYAAGAPRLIGSFDYPNTAAMAYEASALLGVSLIVLERSRVMRYLEAAAIALIVAAMTLTLSRAAVVGICVALVVVAALALVSRRPRVSRAVFAGAVGIAVVALVVEITVAPVARLFTDGERGLYGATYSAPATAAMVDGAARVSVEVTNTGSITWNDTEGGVYQLGFHFLAPGTSTVIGDGNTKASLGTLAPGTAQTVDMTIQTPDPAREYVIAWDVVRRDVGWFSDNGVPVGTTRVGATLSQAPLTHGGNGTLALTSGDLTPTRSDLWAVAVVMIGERPLLGVGPGTYRLRETLYRQLPPGSSSTHSNSMYLELASTTGLLGLAVFLFVVGAALRPLLLLLARRNAARDDAEQISTRTWLVLAAVGGAVIAFLVHGVLDYFLAFNPTSGLWWATLGLALAAPVALGRARRVPAATESDHA
jgi:O-antigen ligase/polysaccharide polymerase Wzy-like membrane protein